MRAVVLCAALLVAPLYALTLKGIGADGPSPVHFEPQVAVLCDAKSDTPYYSQYMSENGRWTSDTKRKVGCLKEKVDILDYCKKVYPKNDITNIVESSHYVKIGNWCKMGFNKCKHTDWVKPYRCLEGQFQSDALLVPENCIFDHVHNQSKCWPFDRWNQTAGQACQDRDHNLRSFAMLLPCGISLFSGVEFVCCPYKDKIQLKKTAPVAADSLLSSDQFDVEEDIDDDDDDDDDDDETNDEEDDDDDYDNYDDMPPSRMSSTSTTTAAPTTSTSTTTMATTTRKVTTTTTTVPPPPPPPSTPDSSHTTPSSPIRNLPTPDTYFTHFDPRDEHKLYKEALNRLEELHREKVTKVMKDWSDLEERYQEMRSKDPHMAEEFKQRMTLRFQQTVQSLEEEGSAEKHQLFAMHQQRVNAHINHRKKEAMNCYVFALNENPPNTHKVQKCLQKLLRSLHKDRHHTIAHYRHLLASSIELAEREKSVTLEHLVDIDHMVNQSLQMLYRYPTLSRKISQLMSDYIQALRSKDDTPGSLLAMTRDAEASILDKYKEEISTTQEDKSRARYPMEMKRNQPHEMVESKEAKLQVETAAEFDANENIETQSHSGQQLQAQQQPTAAKPDQNTAAAAVQHHDHDSEPKISHAQVHDISHGEPTFFTRKNFHHDSRNVHLTLAFAGLSLIAAICVGVAVIRRRNARLPQNQGFIEVDQGISQEERHVANMQINGYENPTYKYFEVKDQ